MGCNTSNEVYAVEGTFWYFAIGSMMNPRSLASRKLVPKESKPAVLADHEIYFFGTNGIAEAVEKKGESFHGVLHRMDEKTMADLDAIERSYTRKTGTARTYDG